MPLPQATNTAPLRGEAATEAILEFGNSYQRPGTSESSGPAMHNGAMNNVVSAAAVVSPWNVLSRRPLFFCSITPPPGCGAPARLQACTAGTANNLQTNAAGNTQRPEA